ncbi:MAG: 23S rRNA (adenine(2503)-C(2))-methyltransferase RlmN [Sedimentisphaerales bacterium]|nr:23S rRNA (adenine(2503)-C(2))-methyltransferase RlmN [Sedimentisphaerales bacterium]
MSKDLKDKTPEELEQLVTELGQKKYFAGYIFSFIHVENATEISLITPLSKAFRQKLIDQGYYISALTIARKLEDKDGTAKYLFTLEDGNQVETVLLPESKRRTVCISTQVGCNLDCQFCATAKIGFRRNLTAGEIADQVETIEADSGKVTNVVYMGMGEPLLNYDAVMKSVKLLNHVEGKNIGIRHITISTCGIAPAIKKLAQEKIHPRLAVSLNAPSDELRTRLMPINKKYPLAGLLKAIQDYQDDTRQRVTFEYVMIKGLNDSAENAKTLVKLVSGIKCHVNLIEYNPHPGCDFAGSGSESIKKFAEVLEYAGIETTMRFKMGRGIKAACGQLGADMAKE